MLEGSVRKTDTKAEAIRRDASPMEWYFPKLGIAYYHANRPADAVAQFQKMKEPWKIPLAAAYVRLGKLDEARTLGAQYLRDYPGWTLGDEAVWPSGRQPQRPGCRKVSDRAWNAASQPRSPMVPGKIERDQSDASPVTDVCFCAAEGPEIARPKSFRSMRRAAAFHPSQTFDAQAETRPSSAEFATMTRCGPSRH